MIRSFVSCLILLSIVAGPVKLSTWTIVAADPVTGAVGVAGASCVPSTPADAVAVLVPGKGAAVAQATWDLVNRNKVYELLRLGQPAEGIIRQVTDRAFDDGVEDRQYGVVTILKGTVKVAAFTGKDTSTWAGSQSDLSRAVTVQGNILAGPSVVADALRAFKSDDSVRGNTLQDRLMRALEAGSRAGGDIRCNNARVKQTAATAFILVARGGDAPYAALDFGVTDQGTKKAPWLAISVAEAQFGPNPVIKLRAKYDDWRKTNRRQ